MWKKQIAKKQRHWLFKYHVMHENSLNFLVCINISNGPIDFDGFLHEESVERCAIYLSVIRMARDEGSKLSIRH